MDFQEFWIPISGYENYLISNFGDIRKSMNRNLGHVNDLLSPIKYKNGYYFVNLSNLGKRKIFSVHQLVMRTFSSIPTHIKDLTVNHIITDKSINIATNLEWCSRGENSLKAHKAGLAGGHGFKKGVKHKSSVPVLQYDKNGNFIKEYESISEAARCVRVDKASINRCSRKNNRTCGGYVWKRKFSTSNKINKMKEPAKSKFLTVRQYANLKQVHHNLIYGLIKDGTIILDYSIIEGKGFIEWEKYSDLAIGDRATTMKRRIINRAKDEIKAEILAELKK